MKRVLLIVLAVGALVGGCTAISRLPALQPPSVPKSPRVTAPAGTAMVTVPVRPVFQRGVDIDAYTYPGQDVAAAARVDVAYIKSLHANAVSVSFPFFLTGHHASAVYATGATPTPGQLAVIVRVAVRAGLFVSVRPLLDEKNVPHCRCTWTPPHLRAWFTSYRRFLLPYATAVQRAGAAEFIVGTEFTRFATSPQWAALDRAVRARFHGQLACSNNWGKLDYTGNCGPGVSEAIDAYPPVRGNLAVGWAMFDFPFHGAVETEVGIDAVAGAYRQPYKHHWPTGAVDEQVQARWFTAACHAAVKEHLGGIYFWPVGLGTTPAGEPTAAFQGAWGGAGARAVAKCFTEIKGSGK